MNKKSNYLSPEIEITPLEGLSLLLDMSADLPDGLEEGDSDTFGDPTRI